MSAPVGAANFEQPASFNFIPENLEQAKAHIAKYPPGRQASAVLPLLWIAQYQNGGWLPKAAMDYVAELLAEFARTERARWPKCSGPAYGTTTTSWPTAATRFIASAT